MFAKNRTQITSEQVVQELLADPDSQWHEYRCRRAITKNQVAALLKDFEIRPIVVHPTKHAADGCRLKLAVVRRIWAGQPHSGFSLLIRQISSRSSRLTGGRPALLRDFQRQ
jgi:uncharacterized protein DUF3631